MSTMGDSLTLRPGSLEGLAGLTQAPAAPSIDARVREAEENTTVVPPVPESLRDSGLPDSLIEQLVLKYLYYRGEMLGREIASQLGLEFSLIDHLLETMKHQHYVGVRKSLGMGNVSGVFYLTESGRSLAREYLDTNQYAGPAPVPLSQYTQVVRLQRLRENWLRPDLLRDAFKGIVVEDDVLAQVGPALNASKSFLIYGQPGNGKSTLAEALFHVQTEPIFMPYAIECQGNIVQVFDPIYHHKIEDTAGALLALSKTTEFDQRWFRCKRPFIVTGGELTLEMLDLTYNKVSKIYDAPFQVKANNGIYLVDDFGRQRATPAEILNRWIVPMERRADYLNFQSGGKITMPFEAFLIFSTNLRPEQLGDEAFLRRIQYKMLLRSPRLPEFLHIFRGVAASRGLEYQEQMLLDFVRRHYTEGGQKLRRCHPRDLLTHAVDIINFEQLPKVLTADLLERSHSSCFVAEYDANE
jgi:predicted ATPase with chaperone activity